jgi:hypothetical protein
MRAQDVQDVQDVQASSHAEAVLMHPNRNAHRVTARAHALRLLGPSRVAQTHDVTAHAQTHSRQTPESGPQPAQAAHHDLLPQQQAGA